MLRLYNSMLRYDPMFTTFESVEVEKPKVEIKFPLILNPIDISDNFTSINPKTNIPMAEDKLNINFNSNHEEPILIENKEETSTNKPKVNLSGRKKQAMDYFMGKGLAKHQAAGLVGNLIRESNLNENAINPHSKALGLAQWLGDRKKAIINKYGKNPTFEQQLDFVWEELNSSHKKGLNALLNSQTVDEAAANAFGYYEFSVGPSGAIADMRKHGLDGMGAYNKGIKFAKELL